MKYFVLLVFVLLMLLFGACTSIRDEKDYTLDQVLAIAKKHSPDCRIIKDLDWQSP